ncbi:TPA: hypothetical protein KKX11_000651 [Legionella pneumophila]|nr:hypothetical protein [Legionella pneumophila subsp. pneumophila]RYX06831.1 hypothetical protein D7214_10370 [Legionella pneumophila]TIE25534.1 hypothetical protein DIZ48_10670 [Legionella pneumophila]TIE46845.1 hypothetical protein DIZ50_10225 [Legionella pneumophila]CZG67568.1 Uncharacterised protein [Legionella pneumophila]
MTHIKPIKSILDHIEAMNLLNIVKLGIYREGGDLSIYAESPEGDVVKQICTPQLSYFFH